MGSVKKIGQKVLGKVTGAAGVDRYSTPESKYDPRLEKLVGTLEARVRGDRPSVAETQLKQTMQENVAATQSGIRSSQGIAPSLRARMLSRAGEEGGRELVTSGALLRAQEQAQAERTLADTLLGATGKDVRKMGVEAGAFEGSRKRRQRMLEKLAEGAGKGTELGAMG